MKMKALLQISMFFILVSCAPKSSQESINAHGDESGIPTSSHEVNKESVDTPCLFDNEVSTLGIGVILAPEQFVLFNDSSLTDAYVSVDMYADEEGIDEICPKFFAPEYAIMNFVCIDSAARWYKVLSGYSTVKYLEKLNAGEFKTWNDYIFDSFGIRRLTANDGSDISSQSLKQVPSDQSVSLQIPDGFEMFCPMELQGDWIRVKYDCFYNLEANPHEGEPCHEFIGQCRNPLTGWLKWRNGNKLLIDIFLIP